MWGLRRWELKGRDPGWNNGGAIVQVVQKKSHFEDSITGDKGDCYWIQSTGTVAEARAGSQIYGALTPIHNCLRAAIA